ncbi:MAG: PspC domain-containing protein [Rikenellaceae bacterium]
MRTENKLYRSRSNRIIAGVCGGISEFFGLTPNTIRLLFVLLSIFGGSGVLAYIILWVIVPEKRRSSDYFNRR